MSHPPDGRVHSVNVSEKKGVQKKPVDSVTLVVEHGIESDAHAGPWHRQVSLLADESAQKMRDAGGDVDVGDFGENITTEGIRVCDLPVGARLRLGPALVEVTQIGKECHAHCAIYHQVGDCVMPREGIFVRVLEGGEVKAGDDIFVEKKSLIHAAVLTSSDKGARGERDDASGDVLEEALRELGVAQVERAIVPDEADQIAAALRHWADETPVNLILTTGGTGMTSRDVTPEATLDGARPSGARLRRGHARRLARQDAARDALARGERHPRQDAHHQHAGEPARLSRAVRDDRRGAAARGGEAARPGRRLRSAQRAAERAARRLIPTEPGRPLTGRYPTRFARGSSARASVRATGPVSRRTYRGPVWRGHLRLTTVGRARLDWALAASRRSAHAPGQPRNRCRARRVTLSRPDRPLAG